MLTGTILVALTLSVAGLQESAPRDTYEWLGDCPDACCGYSTEWTAKQDTPALSDPLPPDAQAAAGEPAFIVRAGETVRAVTGTLQLLERGRAVMREDFSTDASYANLSARHRQTITLLAGEEVHLLAPRGEGTWRIWHHGRILDAHLYRIAGEDACRARDTACAGVIIREPVTRWWVMVVTARGQTGWVVGSDRFDRPVPCR